MHIYIKRMFFMTYFGEEYKKLQYLCIYVLLFYK